MNDEQSPFIKTKTPNGPERISVQIPEEGAEMKKQKRKKMPLKKFYVLLGVCLLIFGVATGVGLYFLLPKNVANSELSSAIFTDKTTTSSTTTYSPLTGLPLSDASLANSPTYCIQVPNGTDGARPQAGLSDAGVVFEAIAEAGITRFAAIYQNPSASVIGPIRSLRIYYLNWDTPFDCTVTHAGGATDALAALASGGYRDLTENYTYMWRGDSSQRRWNNLFTSASYLKQFNSDKGYSSSNVKGFTRMTPEAADTARVNALATNILDIDTATSTSVKEMTPKVTKIYFDYASSSNYDPVYAYDATTNTYARSYGSGVAHTSYNCSEGAGEVTPEASCGEPTQLSPSVVIAMIVSEQRASDNYHEDITSLGSGKAYIFQNGDVIQGTWEKPNAETQIVFKDTAGKEISLVPGQTWVSAIPDYGSVNYE